MISSSSKNSFQIFVNGLPFSGKDLVPLIEESVIGNEAVFQSPLGPRKIVYCDWFASGKSLSFIENYISTQVLPFYANTHTESGINGSRMQILREMSRDVIKSAINSSSLPQDSISLIFTGTGSTGALNKLAYMFLNKKQSLMTRCKFALLGRPVVFISIQEHHSNILPWRLSGAKIVFIKNTKDTFQISLEDLEKNLKKYKHHPLKIGAFSAGSNVTGVLNDTVLISILLHSYNTYAVFDYAGVGSYVEMDMNVSPIPLDKQESDSVSGIVTSSLSLSKKLKSLKESGLSSRQIYSILQSHDKSITAHIDALVLSPHKLIGGPGTPGALAIRNTTLQEITGPDYTPSQVGGGIVDFVTMTKHIIIAHPENREETGTPGIIESIRAGLAFTVKQSVGCDVIAELENDHLNIIRAKLSTCPEITVLGGLENKIPVLSFLIKHGSKYLHYNYVAALLNDFFGIQARAGCSCAGPYGIELLHITPDLVEEYEDVCTAKPGSKKVPLTSFKPGFARLSFNYFTKREDVEFVLDAMIWISRNAGRVRAAYNYDVESGIWVFVKKQGDVEKCEDGTAIKIGRFGAWYVPSTAPPTKAECFLLADEFAREMEQEKTVVQKSESKERIDQDERLTKLKWFAD